MKAKDERKRVASSIASASDAIRCVRLSSPVSGSCRDSFRSCSSRAWRSLLRRTMPCARAGLPSAPANQHAGFLDPEHRRGGARPHAIFDPVGCAVAAAGERRRAERVAPDRAAPARSAWKTPRRWPARPPGCRRKPRRHDHSRPSHRLRCPKTKAAWPSMREDGGSLRDGANVTIASLRDTAESDSPAAE